jgi:flagellin-like hook-associated protein FlgL
LLGSGPRGATLFTGTTGAAVGTGGTDTGTGRDVLQIRHAQTVYGSPPATGLAASASSSGNDTVLGSGHSVTVTTDASGNGTISLDGGPAVAFTAADTNLQVTGPNGEIIHVDTSAMAPNLAPGTVVPIQASGTLSTDGGVTSTAINFGSGAQQVVDSETGAVLHVDATAISGTGDEQVTYPGTSDFITSIIAIRDILMDTTRTASDVSTQMNIAIADLDAGATAVTRSLSVLGSRAGQLESIEGRLGDLGATLDGLSGEIADADISKVISDMSRYETLYQASLALTTRVNSMSLLNYL